MWSSLVSRAAMGVVVAGALAASTLPSSAAGPFSSFAGNWTGNGTVSTTSGSKERLRCRAHYDVGGGGTSMTQNLTCASDSYKFNVVSTVSSDGNSISGDWSETSRGANGRISGSITPTQVSAYVSGVGFTARIGITAKGGSQAVTISPTGTDISNVYVSMSKS